MSQAGAAWARERGAALRPAALPVTELAAGRGRRTARRISVPD